MTLTCHLTSLGSVADLSSRDANRSMSAHSSLQVVDVSGFVDHAGSTTAILLILQHASWVCVAMKLFTSKVASRFGLWHVALPPPELKVIMFHLQQSLFWDSIIVMSMLWELGPMLTPAKILASVQFYCDCVPQASRRR